MALTVLYVTDSWLVSWLGFMAYQPLLTEKYWSFWDAEIERWEMETTTSPKIKDRAFIPIAFII